MLAGGRESWLCGAQMRAGKLAVGLESFLRWHASSLYGAQMRAGKLAVGLGSYLRRAYISV